MSLRSGTKLDRILSVLRQEILDGRWAVGENLPNEQDLAQRFGCSPGTINKAVGILAHEGLVVRRNRVGTRVLSNSLKSENDALDLDSVAFVFPSEQHEGIWRTLRGFQSAAQEQKRRVIMLGTGLDYRKETEVLARLSEFDVRGAVVFPIIPTPEAQMDFQKAVTGTKFPIVLTEVSLPGAIVPAVTVDGFDAGYTMTRHVVERGAKNIGYISNYTIAPFMRDRYQGYRRALQEAGLAAPEDGVYLDPSISPNFQDPISETESFVAEYAERSSHLDAVVCANDFIALALMEHLEKMGVSAPKDILITGIDDFEAAAAARVPLTTYAVPYEQMGKKAFEILISRQNGSDHSPSEIQVRGKIVVRKSA
jgi:GntR family transcriptional regulator of arabinose operon